MNCLKGIRVLDFTQFLSASYCSQLLGDLGADVIKIEQPGKGEVYRNYGPKFVNGESSSFLSVNRNKRALALDIKHQDAGEVIEKLVLNADVIVENFRPGKLSKYGLDYDTVKKINPEIIYCSVSGFGQTGPYATKGGFDLIAQGMAGIMSVTGMEGGESVKVGYPITDIGSGMYGAIGVLAAIVTRNQTGKGQWVDTSLYETGVAWGLMAAGNYFASEDIPDKMGSVSPLNAPYQSFNVKDGSFTMGTGNQLLWEKFCNTFNMSHLIDDPKYADNVLRVQNNKELADNISENIKNFTVNECLKKLDSIGVPCGPINNIKQVVNDPQVIDRDMVIEMEHKTAGKIKNIGLPIKFSDDKYETRYAPPLLGEHTEEVLQEVGFSREQIAKYINLGVIEG